MKKALLGAVVAMLLVPTVFVVWIGSLDLNGYKDRIEQEIHGRTGRAVSLDGDIDVAWSLSPTLVVAGVQVANAEWSVEPRMLAVDRLEIRVAVLALLAGELDVEQFHLKGGGLLLERNDDGRANWRIGGAGGTSTSAPLFAFGDMSVEDFTVRYRDAASGVVRTYVVERFEAAVEDGPRPINFNGRVVVNDAALSISGTVSNPGVVPFGFDVTMKGDGLEVTQSGSVADLALGTGVAVDLSLRAVDGKTLARLIGQPLGDHPAVRLTGRMTGEFTHLRVTDLRVGYGDAEAVGELDVDLRDARPSVRGNLAMEQFDARPFLPPAENAGARSPGPGARLIPDTPFGVLSLPAADLDVNLALGRLTLHDVEVGQVVVGLKSADGVLTLDPLTATVGTSTVNGKARVTPRADVLDLNLALTAPGLDIATLLEVLGVAPNLDGRADLTLALEGLGQTPAAVAASLDGQIRLKLEGARARLGGMDALVGGLAGLFTAKGADAEGWTALECGALSMDFDAGVGRTRLLVDADAAVITGDGNINLGNEQLDMLVKPEPKSVTLNLSVPVRVAGTLANPTMAPDEASALRRLGTLAGAVLFPPAALLAFADTGGGSDPCLERAAVTSTESDRSSLGQQANEVGKGVTEGAKKAAKSVGEGAKKAVEGVTEGLKGLFQ